MIALDKVFPARHLDRVGGLGYIAGEPNPDPEGIDGLLTVDDVPGARQISYFEEKTNRLIAQNWSNPDGTYRLDGVSPDIEIMIVAKDWSRTWAHVIQGGVRPSTVPLVINAGTWTVPIGVPFAGVVRVLYGVGETATTITGTLPEGLVANDGHISGAWPTGIVGQYPLAVEVVDSQMQVRTAEIVLDLVLLPVKLTASPAVPTALAVSEAMTPITFVASGGEGPYTYSVSAGSLPSGTSLDPVTGVWSGTPDTEDEYSFTIKVTGVRGSAETEYTVDVLPAYATLNPSDMGINVALSEGNLLATATGGNGYLVRSTAEIVAKTYFEVEFVVNSSGIGTIGAGVANLSQGLGDSFYNTSNGWSVWGTSPGARNNSATTSSFSVANGDVFGFAVDPSTNKMWIRKNGTWLTGDPAAGTGAMWSNLSGSLYAAAMPWVSGNSLRMRFDPATFSHSAPTGFGPLTA